MKGVLAPDGAALHARCSGLRELRWVALAVVFAVLWFALLQTRHLLDPDEGRYAEIAREMVVSGDWLTPRLDDFVYLEKPPLQYWATALAFDIFGEHNWTARLWSALTGFVAVLLTFYAAMRLHRLRTGLYAAAILASGLLFFGIGHLNTLDTGLSFFLTAAVFVLALALRDGASAHERRYAIPLACIAAGLAVLSKGLIGVVLPAAALVAYSLLYRDYRLWSRIAVFEGIAIVLAITAPWFAAVERSNPHFLEFFFVHEHFARFLAPVQHREAWWFFVPVLIAGALPWTLPVLGGWWHALRDRQAPRPHAFLALWALVVFVFFSCSRSKLPPYILPIFPALAILGAAYIQRASRRAIVRQVSTASFLVAALLAAVPLAAAFRPELAPHLSLAGAQCVLGAALLWTAAGFAVSHFANPRRMRAAIVAIALLAMAADQLLLVSYESLAPAKSTFRLAQQISAHLEPTTRVYTLQTYPQTLPVYLRRTVTIVDFEGELGFGEARDPTKRIATLETFEREWRSDRDAVAVMEPPLYSVLKAKGLPMELVASDTARVAVMRASSRAVSR